MSNCIVFALGRWFSSGGFVIIRKSKFGWWPHMLWSKDLVTYEAFIPLKKPRKRWFPPLWFRGKVQVMRGPSH